MVNITIKILWFTTTGNTCIINSWNNISNWNSYYWKYNNTIIWFWGVKFWKKLNKKNKKIRNLFFRTFRRGIYDLKVWPNVPPDVKFNSSTPGKIESTSNVEQILSNHTNQTIKPLSSSSIPTITTANLQYNRKQITSKPLNITWNEDSAYPMLDELSRIAKVKKKKNSIRAFLFFYFFS